MTLIFLFILGLAVGSFLNVLIDRLPQEKNIIGRSHCDFCKKKLKAGDLIPLVSFIALGGKCRYCHKKLSFQYPLVELLTGIAFVLTWLYSPAVNFELRIAYLGLISCLIVVFFADRKYRIIPDQIQIILLLFAAGTIYLLDVPTAFSWFIHLRDGAIVMSPILIIYLVTKGKGIGFADVKFAFIIGFFLQVVAGLFAIYMSFIIGAIYGVFLLILRKKKMKDVIAFGPFMALGFAVMIFYGQPIISYISSSYF